MIINEKHIAGVIRSPTVQEELKSIQRKNVENAIDDLDTDEVNGYINATFDAMFSDSALKSYLLKETAQTVISNIKIKDDFDLSIFKDFPDERKEIVLNQQELFRYVKDDDLMRVMHISMTSQGQIFYKSFTIEPETNAYSENYFTDAGTKEKCNLFIKILIFLHLSDVTEVYLKPNGKTGTKAQGKVINKISSSFIVVDTTWNITSIRTKGFSVRGHFRLQACGRERQSRKLVFIDQFEKHGYIRNAKKINNV